MDEAMDQQGVVIYPSPPDSPPMITRAHGELTRQHGSGTICTIPLENKGKLIGGLTLERPADKVFDSATLEACEAAAALVGPILDTKRAEDRLLIRKAADSFDTQLRRLLGPGYLIRKLILLLILTLGASFTGYLLPWDQLAFWAITVGTSIINYEPFLGGVIKSMVVGGPEVGQEALTRFYALHIMVIPAAMALLTSIHLWRVRKDGGLAVQDSTDQEEGE